MLLTEELVTSGRAERVTDVPVGPARHMDLEDCVAGLAEDPVRPEWPIQLALGDSQQGAGERDGHQTHTSRSAVYRKETEAGGVCACLRISPLIRKHRLVWCES